MVEKISPRAGRELGTARSVGHGLTHWATGTPGRLRQLLESRLRQQTATEKSQTHVERDILVPWVRI